MHAVFLLEADMPRVWLAGCRGTGRWKFAVQWHMKIAFGAALKGWR